MTTATTPTVDVTAPALECRTDRATLAHALTTVGVGMVRRPTVSQLGGVLLDGRDGHLTLTATDLETVASVRVPDTVRAPGRLLIDHTEATKLFGALAKGIRKRDVGTMPVAVRMTDVGMAVLELDEYTLPVPIYPPEDFPTLPEAPPTVAEANREQFTTDAARAGRCGHRRHVADAHGRSDADHVRHAHARRYRAGRDHVRHSSVAARLRVC